MTFRRPNKKESFNTPLKGLANPDLTPRISRKETKTPYSNRKNDSNEEDGQDQQKWKMTNILNLPLHEKIDQFIKLLSMTN